MTAFALEPSGCEERTLRNPVWFQNILGVDL